MTDKDKKMLQSALWHISNSVTNGKSQTAECELTQWLKGKFNALPAEQQSNSLDNFIHTLLETYPTNKNEVPIEALNDYHQGLICGARKTYNWILESAIDGCYIKRNRYTKENVLNGLSVTCDTIQKFKDGDKVKVIVIKEDEECSTE